MTVSDRRDRECDPMLHIRVTTLGMGSVSFTTQRATLAEARELGDSLAEPCEIRVYEPGFRAVDGKPFLRLLETFTVTPAPDPPVSDEDFGECTCTYGAYSKIGGGSGWGISKFDDACPIHGEF